MSEANPRAWPAPPRRALGGKVRVLVVDDSAVARDLLERGLSRDPGIEVVGKAADVYAARDKIVFLSPDVVTLDVMMPGMDGIEFLRRLMPQRPVPVVMVSAATGEGSRLALEALDAGALSVVAKPAARDGAGLAAMVEELAERVKEAARADVSRMRPPPRPALSEGAVAPRAGRAGPAGQAGFAGPLPGQKPGAPSRMGGWTRRLVAIGASTGGTHALGRIIPALPSDMPPTLVVQHMPAGFTRMFAEALDRVSAVRVREAGDGDALEEGLVLVAPGDLQLRLEVRGSGWAVSCKPGPKVSGHRPSVDVLFESAAETAGDEALGVLLTGMGRDGAEGLLSMRKAGARCLAQDEGSSVVFGMPMEAWRNGAAERLVPLEGMAEAIVAAARAPRAPDGRP